MEAWESRSGPSRAAGDAAAQGGMEPTWKAGGGPSGDSGEVGCSDQDGSLRRLF